MVALPDVYHYITHHHSITSSICPPGLLGSCHAAQKKAQVRAPREASKLAVVSASTAVMAPPLCKIRDVSVASDTTHPPSCTPADSRQQIADSRPETADTPPVFGYILQYHSLTKRRRYLDQSRNSKRANYQDDSLTKGSAC